MPAILEVDHLVKKYGDFEAVRGLSFTVEEGEVFGLLGPNGAGKTTTLSMPTCLFPPTQGSIRIYGHDEHRLKVADDQEAPALKQAGWKLHRQEHPHLAVMSIGDREMMI